MDFNLRERLEELAEPAYRDFSLALLPDIECTMLGVRLPVLRSLAAEIARSEWRDYLAEEPGDSFEELMVFGMVIGKVKIPLEERLRLVSGFVPRINSWSLCDSFVSGLKFARLHRAEVLRFLQPLFFAQGEYERRFAVVMLLNHFAEAEYAADAFEIFERMKPQEYYVKMAVAWAISTYFVSCVEDTLEYLKSSALDDDTINKAIQKIVDSRRVSEDDKNAARSLRRRKNGK